MINNGSLHYDHDRDGTHTELAGCEVKARNLPTETHILIRYVGNTLTGKFYLYFLKFSILFQYKNNFNLYILIHINLWFSNDGFGR